MRPDPDTPRSRSWYRALLCLYPRAYPARFGASLMQTFDDLQREANLSGVALLRFTLWIFADTAVGVVRERVSLVEADMNNKPVAVLGALCLAPFSAVFALGTGRQ